MALYDRDSECALIDRLIDDARSGRSGVLVLRGDPGLGKSSLLDYAVGGAGGLQLLSCRGFEAESQLAFAGLSDVLRPLAGRLDALPDPQRAALEGVLSIRTLAMADRLTVNIGVLSVLAAAAESQPVLVTIDDSQWLDAASLEALAGRHRDRREPLFQAGPAGRHPDRRAGRAAVLGPRSGAGLRRAPAGC